MKSSKVFQQRALIAVFAVVMAAFMWPAQATAQYYPEGCGYCTQKETDDGWYHWFPSHGLFRRCNTNKGCHFSEYPSKCGALHSPCFMWMPQVDGIESAVGEGDFPKLKEVLAELDNWDYDPTSHALSFTCSGYTVARYVLPEELRHAVALLPTNDRKDPWPQEPDREEAGTRS